MSGYSSCLRDHSSYYCPRAIRNFQLNPHAKEFNPLALASLPGSSTVSSSTSSVSNGSPSLSVQLLFLVQGSVGSSPSLTAGRPRPFSKSPRNNRGPGGGGGGGLFTSPPEQPPHSSYIGAPLMPRPLQSPGQCM